ncbi:MAG: hypothetical protein H8D62_03330 [Bacteroidetes bacterium]|nr:hypothetical protein [Bacteroidota bacterium]
MMKRASLFLLISCFFQVVLAQNWDPLTVDNKYNYTLGTSEILSHTLWIDSMQGNVHYLNRIITDIPGIITHDFKNQPQFLMRQMEDLGSGWYHFNDTSSFVIHATANSGASWLLTH